MCGGGSSIGFAQRMYQQNSQIETNSATDAIHHAALAAAFDTRPGSALPLVVVLISCSDA